MSGDAMKKVQSGDRLQIPAETFNTFIDTARAFRATQQDRGANPLPELRDSNVILVKNNSGADRQRFDVLGIDDVLITPTDNLDQFKTRPALVGVSPTLADHLGKFVVLLCPLAQGDIGPAAISGIVPCKVKVESTASDPLTGQSWYSYADIEADTTSRLILRPFGAAQVLWKAGTGAGEQWALVRLGPPGGIVTLRGTLAAALDQGGYADASLNYNGSTYPQRVYDLLMKSGATAIASGKKIAATYFPDEQKFYVTEAECP